MKKVESDQIDKIVALHAAGWSTVKLAERYSVSRQSISNYLKSRGIDLGHPRRDINVGMVMSDWNADKPVRDIMKTYGFKTLDDFHNWMNSMRKQGWSFKRRR